MSRRKWGGGGGVVGVGAANRLQHTTEPVMFVMIDFYDYVLLHITWFAAAAGAANQIHSFEGWTM